MSGVTWSIIALADYLNVDEPELIVSSTTYTFRITNTSTDNTKAANVGFFLREADIEGEVDFPSSEGIVIDWYDILQWGEANPAEGMFLTQGLTTTQFTLSNGVISSPIPLSVGSGTEGDEIESGASVDITIEVIPPGSVSARRLYFALDLDFTPTEGV